MASSDAMLRAAPLLLLCACGPKASSDGDDKEPAELLEEACASFCERALSCPLGNYAETLEFEGEQTCYANCLIFHADTPLRRRGRRLSSRVQLLSFGAAPRGDAQSHRIRRTISSAA